MGPEYPDGSRPDGSYPDGWHRSEATPPPPDGTGGTPEPGAPGPTPPASDILPLRDWFAHHSLRSFPVLLFLALICIPSIALVILGTTATARTFADVAWIFAAYFALAWLLLLGVIVRPAHVTRMMLLLIIAIALITEVPLAAGLETALHDSDTSLVASIFTIGVPEEVAKALPVLIVALLYRGRHHLEPRDYLFLGAVSGLAFGASEVVRYFTINGVDQFHQVVQGSLPVIGRLQRAGNSAADSLFFALIGPVLGFILNFVWRFLTDPISHALWSGLTGYFIGLAFTRRHRWYAVGFGLVPAAILHGLNDWTRVGGHIAWIFVTLVSGILFLGYAKVGSRVPGQVQDGSGRPLFLETPAQEHARHAAQRRREPPAPVPAGEEQQEAPTPWWEQHE